MKREIKILFAIVIIMMLVPTQYAKAVTTSEIVQDLNFEAIGSADEIQNNLDDGSRTNYDTWDPIPSGVWFGGWAIESQNRLSEVPDTDFQIALATVCQFGSDIIMSGAARTLVRLPVFTSDDPWTRARLNVYEISRDSNWTFTRENQTADTLGVDLGHLRVNFTAGTHELIFWSTDYDPSDASPTDGDDHFSRSNRTYAWVDAPIKPGAYYLFITYVWFAADKYVEVLVQPDTLDSEGDWNRSTLAVYNEQAPDTYTLDVDNFNASWGYSFDFQHGFGNSAYGLNIYALDGDDIEFFSYVDLDQVVGTDYLTFMLPYRSTVDNISWDVTIQEFDPSDGTIIDIANYLNYICRDFILLSLEQDWATCSTAKGLALTGWFRISAQVNNNTRLWLPLWDTPEATGEARIDHSWGGSVAPNDIWDSETIVNYDFQQKVTHDPAVGDDYHYHWMVQHSIQFNDYRWDRTVPPGTGTESLDPTENMTLTNKIVYGVGSFLIRAGNTIFPFNMPLGTALRAAGTAAQAIAQADILPDFAGWTMDRLYQIRDFFAGIGQWIWRAAQSVIGAISWFVETVTYFASIILGMIIFGFAIIILFLSLWFSAKFAQMIVEGLRGRYDRSIALMGEVSGTVTNAIPRK